jgi:YebC/PmpR family DNA-binding regulatory protein
MSGHSKWATIKRKKGKLDAARGRIFTRLIKEITVAARDGGGDPYGPNGVAVFVDCLTDNRNRTVAEIRHIFSKYNGNLGENGCVAWMFDKKGILAVKSDGIEEDSLMEIALDAGASDIQTQEDAFEITTEPGDLEKVRGELEKASLPILEAEVRRIPQNTIKLDRKGAESMMKLMEALEDHDDVQQVSANFDIDDAIMEELSA